jgi:hypothetical protein
MKLQIRPAQSRAPRDAPRIALRGQQSAAGRQSEQTPPRFESKARRRELLNLLRVRNAAKHLNHLPSPGCAIHAIMRGTYSFCDLIPAVLSMIQPARIEYLAATTLGFSRKAALQLLDLLDSGGVARLDFICADFFAKSDPEITLFAREEIQRRGSRFAAARCHAKIILFQTSDGQHFTSESSANIRACRSIEQFALTNCPELFEFHRGWIDEIMVSDGQTKKAD